MTWINVNIESFCERDDRRRFHMATAELEFWRDEAKRLQDTLDNIYSRAEDGEPTELWRQGVKIVLVREREGE
jgi:hypothetical protein